MNELQTFSNALIGNIRVTMINGEPYFVGKDVADILGYKNTNDAISKRVDSEDKTDGVAIRDPMGREQHPILINESGLYSLIITSKKQEAKRFKHWITSEVLPAIRKHGVYATEEILNDPDVLIQALLELKEERAKRQAMETTIAAKDQQLLELKPKVSYYDIVLNCKDLIEITKIAKDFGWSGIRMNQYLHEKKIQYKTADGQWLLYQKYAAEGYTATRTHIYKDSSGTERSKIHTYWTQKGRLFIYELMKADGYLPTIEKEETYGN